MKSNIFWAITKIPFILKSSIDQETKNTTTFRRLIKPPFNKPPPRINEISAKWNFFLGENTQEIENLIPPPDKGIFESGEGGGY